MAKKTIKTSQSTDGSLSKESILESLEEKEDLLDEMSVIAKIGGWKFDAATGKQVWTKEVYRIHEVDPKTFSPSVDSGINFYTEKSRPVIESAVKLVIEKGQPFDVELEIITAKGRHRLVRAIGRAKQIKGKTISVSGVFQDITDRKSVEERYRYLFDNSRDAIMFLKAPRWNFFEGNSATLKLFNIKSNQEFESLSPADLSPQYQPDGQPSDKKAKEMIEIALKNGFNTFDWQHKKFKGEPFMASVALTKMEIGSEVILQAIVRDTTEELQVAQKLKVKMDELEKVNKLMIGRELRMIELKNQLKAKSPNK